MKTDDDDEAAIPIAIVGIACRFPGGATSPDAFWEIISGGRSTHTEIPRSRLNVDGFYHPDPRRPDSVWSSRQHFFF